jgi:integrase
MASFVKHGDGWRAHVCVDGRRASQTFRTRREAESWAVKQTEKKSRETNITFGQAAEQWLAHYLPQLKNPVHQRGVSQSVRDYMMPALAQRVLGDIRRRELVEVVRNVAARGTIDLSHRVGQRLAAIFDHAVDNGEIESHPAAGLARVLPKYKKGHMPSVQPEELPKLLCDIASYPEPVTRIGLQLLAHTFVRTTELIGAKWEEFNFKEDIWVIPESRMKAGKPHVVPLSKQTRALLEELKPMTDEAPYLLASPFNRLSSISNNTLLFALYRLGYKGKMTGHGFRSVASTILNKSRKWDKDAIERQLAHQETDKVRAAYNFAEHLDERIPMMQWWSNYLETNASSTAR